MNSNIIFCLIFICIFINVVNGQTNNTKEHKWQKELDVALKADDVKKSPYYKDKIMKIPISEEAGEELLQHWTDQAFSGLISALATKRLKLLEEYDRDKHENCTKDADDLVKHARCFVQLEKDQKITHLLRRRKLLDKKSRVSKSNSSNSRSSSVETQNISENRGKTKRVYPKLRRKSISLKSHENVESIDMKVSKIKRKSVELKSTEIRLGPLQYEIDNKSVKLSHKKKTKRNRIPLHQEALTNIIGEFHLQRAKRSIKIVNRDRYELKSDGDRSTFGIITKHLTNTVKILKNKDKLTRWQDIIGRIKSEAKVLKQRKKIEDITRKRIRAYSRTAEERNHRRKDYVKTNGDLRRLASMEKYIDDEEARDMFHQKINNMTEEERIALIPVDMIRQAVKIGLSLNQKNVSDFEKKSLRLISPRFMSILPEDEEIQKNQIDILSPSLFSLHDDGNELERNTSLSRLLGSTLSSTDSQNFIDFLVEATGVAEAVQDAENKIIDAQRLKDDAMGRGPDGQPLYFTKENVTSRYPSEAKKIEIFEKLDKMYTIEQLKDMNRTGYTIMTEKQLELIYGDDSEYKNPNLLAAVRNKTRSQINREIQKTIRQISEEKLKFEVRKKDIVLSPVVLTPIINNAAMASQALVLSPALMSPLIQSPAIFGTVVLSPWAFIPVILSPRILSPVILDPFVFVPIILSPLALDPVILSPGIFNPIILSPLLMCPFVLSPQCMTPLILSPFALTPLIATPLVLSPLVLSPFVLSPQVLSPQFVTAIILSPHALSPAVESNGALVTVLASPGWLS